MLSTIAVCYEVDSLGSAAQKNDLSRLRRVEELPDSPASALVRKSGLLAQEVDAAVNIGIFIRIVVLQRIRYRQRLLRGRRIV